MWAHHVLVDKLNQIIGFQVGKTLNNQNSSSRDLLVLNCLYHLNIHIYVGIFRNGI